MRDECIYPEIYIQMYLQNIDSKALADLTGISYVSLRRKMRGITLFDIEEAKAIQKAFNCGKTLDELFKTLIEANTVG